MLIKITHYMTNKVINFTGIAALVLLVLASVVFQASRPAFASAPSGQPAYVATTSAITLGPTRALNSSLFGTSTISETRSNCSARVITTTAQPIMLSFTTNSSTTVSATVGHYQAASTTIAYDSGLYGCGYWTAYAFGTTTITLTETN